MRDERLRSMPVTPLPGVTASLVADAVREVSTAALNLEVSAVTRVDWFNAYLRWSNEASRKLACLCRPVMSKG